MDTKEIIETWINQGYGDNCFWEGWPECPTPEDDLNPKMVASELATLREQVKRLRDALEFYADRGYDGYDVTLGDYNLSMSVGVIIQDAGDKAKEALK